MACPHYSDGDYAMRTPLPTEKFRSGVKICVCMCGICLGWLDLNGVCHYSPALPTVAVREKVKEFLTGEPALRFRKLEPKVIDMAEHGRKYGLLSAAGRMQKMTPERRSEVARIAAKARWSKRGKPNAS